MKSIMRLFVLPVLLLTFSLAHAALPRDPSEHFFEQTLGNLQDDLQDAKDQGKKGIWLFFEQEECPFCHRMKTLILNQPEVQDYFKKYFIIYPIDIELTTELTDFQGKSTTMKKLFAKIAKNRGATPVLAYFDLTGKMVIRYTGASTGVEEFLWLGEYASQEMYKKMNFSKFKRMKRRQKR